MAGQRVSDNPLTVMPPRQRPARGRGRASDPTRGLPISLPQLLPPLPPPPFQPPHIQPLLGHPPAGGQYHVAGPAMNGPQAYAQAYGAPYPPMYPPIQYPQLAPLGASVGTGQFQLWDYAHYPMACPLAPVPHPMAMHPGNSGFTPANGTGAPVVGDTCARVELRSAERGESGGTTAVSTPAVRAVKNYPNKQLGEGGKWYSLWLGNSTLMSSSLAVHG